MYIVVLFYYDLGYIQDITADGYLVVTLEQIFVSPFF